MKICDLCVNIPLVSRGFDNAEDIVENHIQKLSSTGDYVYFSTSNNIDPKKAADIKYILLSNKSGLRYLCQIVNYEFFENSGIPCDSSKYSPNKYINEPKKHWFKICSIKSITPNQTKKFILLNEKVQKSYGNVETYIENTKRLQIFYFKKL